MSTLEEYFINKGFPKSYQKAYKEAYQKAFQEGILESKIEIVQKMLAQGFAFEVIKTCTGLTLQKIQEVAESLKRTVASQTAGAPA